MSAYVFSGATPTTGYEPWIYDLTAATASPLGDLVSGPDWGIGSVPASYVRFGIGAFFSGRTEDGGQELWFTDGTAAGTHLVRDIAPGPRNSIPEHFAVSQSGLAYFAATTYETGTELWITDGTTSGTRLLVDLRVGAANTSPYNLQSFDDGVIFQTRELGGVWYASSAGAVQLSEPGGGFGYADVVVTDDSIFFNRPLRNRAELWLSDGTTAGTRLVFGDENPFGISDVRNPAVASGRCFFTAETISGYSRLYVTDGTVQGTKPLIASGVDLSYDLRSTASHVFLGNV